MGILFNADTDALGAEPPTVAPGSAGTFALWIKPSWDWNDSTDHEFVWYRGAAETTRLQYQKFSDNNIYVGWVTGGTNYRLSVSGSGLFSSGVWAPHVFTWDDTANTRELWVNGSSAVSSTGSFSTGTVATETSLGRGTTASYDTADAVFSWYALWDRVLTDAEVAAFSNGVAPVVIAPDALISYLPLRIGGQDQVDEISGDTWTQSGTANAESYPVVHPGPIIVTREAALPGAGDALLLDSDLTDNLLLDSDLTDVLLLQAAAGGTTRPQGPMGHPFAGAFGGPL